MGIYWILIIVTPFNNFLNTLNLINSIIKLKGFIEWLIYSELKQTYIERLLTWFKSLFQHEGQSWSIL